MGTTCTEQKRDQEQRSRPWLSPLVRAQAGHSGEPWEVPRLVVTISRCLWLGHPP